VVKSLVLISAIVAALALALVPVAGAGWTAYWGPGTFRQPPNGPQGATSGFNYWTSQEVYRPTGHPFYLWYYDGSNHYSTDNSTSNPFVWGAYGYNQVGCFWDYTLDTGTSSLSPVTCEDYI
jgi:hypothetical protein